MKHLLSLFVSLVLMIVTSAICKAEFASSRSSIHNNINNIINNNNVVVKRNKVVNEEEQHGQISRNKGSPLDGNNAHKDIKNKGKSPKKMSSSALSKTGRLVNRFHWMIEINGFNVSSTRDSDSPSGKMNVTSVGKDLVQIKGIKSNGFICMNSQSGDVFVSAFPTKSCTFKEHLEENFHSSFRLNIPDSRWYLGIDKEGKFLIKNTLKPDFATLFQLIS